MYATIYFAIKQQYNSIKEKKMKTAGDEEKCFIFSDTACIA